jgi:hypothetical protein
METSHLFSELRFETWIFQTRRRLSRRLVVTGKKLACICIVCVHTYIHTRTYIHAYTFMYIGTGILVYVLNTTFETRLESCIHPLGGFFLRICTYFS